MSGARSLHPPFRARTPEPSSRFVVTLRGEAMAWPSAEKELAPVHDAAPFSFEEETKLLHEWQKELYKTVMNEIHLALISLGCKIHDALLQIDKEKEQHIPNTYISETNTNIDDSTSAIQPAVSPVILVRIKQEEDLCCDDQNGLDHLAPRNSPSRGVLDVLYTVKGDENQPSKGFTEMHSTRSTASLSTAVPAPMAICSLSPKLHTETQSQERHEGRSTGSGTTTRKQVGGNYVQCNNGVPFKSVTGKSEAKMLHYSKKATHIQSQVWPQSNQEISREEITQIEGGFRSSLQTQYRLTTTSVNLSDPVKGCGSIMKNSNHPTYQTHTLQNSEPNAWTGSERRFYQKHGVMRLQRPQPQKRPYSCLECEKGFRTKSALITHQRTHTGEKPFQCTECGKSFSQTGVLIRHKRTHTGERPYQCASCEKSFNRKEHLIIHQRTHKRERLGGVCGVRLLASANKTKTLGPYHPL